MLSPSAERCWVVTLLAVFLGLGVWSIRTQGPTADEFAHHVASGYSYLVSGDFRMNPASPPLPRMWAALPLLFLNAKAPLDHPSWETGNSLEFARQFFYVANNRPVEFIQWARVPNLLIGALFGLLFYLWVRARLGSVAAIAGLALFYGCTDILAHSTVATADLGVAFFFFLTIWSLETYLNQNSWTAALCVGLFLAGAFLSKFSALIFLPILFVICVFSGRWRAIKAGHVVGAAGIFLVVLWAGYGFELKPLLTHTPAPEKKIEVYRKIGGDNLVRFASEVPVPFSTFSSALVSMLHTRSQGTRAFFMGEWSMRGWPQYYFVAFLVKNSPALILLISFGLFWIKKMAARWVLLVTLIVPIALFFGLTMTDRAQAGIRYFLPIYPLFIFIAALAFRTLWESRSKVGRVLASTLLLWHVGEALAVSPNFLTYFSSIAGGPSAGYRILRDSNLDWGQGLAPLARHASSKDYGVIALDCPWPADPSSYGVNFRPVTDAERQAPQKTVYAIFAHTLDGYDWAKDRQPTARIANSVFIYDLR